MMTFDIISPEEFKSFANNSQYGNFMQSTERQALRQRMHYDTHLLGVKRDGTLIAVGLLVVKDHEAWMQLGPLLDYADSDLLQFFLRQLTHFCEQHSIYELEIYPPLLRSVRSIDGSSLADYDRASIFDIFAANGFTHMGFSSKLDFKALRWMFVKDLKDLPTMRDVELSFNASTRKKYHKTLRELEIHVLKDKSELSDWLRPLEESNARNHIKTRPLQYFEDLWDTFGDQATFVEARLPDTHAVVSSELDIWTPQESVAFLAGTTESLKHYNGITAIKGWQLAECLRRGQTRANFYGIDGIFTSDNPLLKSKSGFGGVVEEYVGGFKRLIRPAKYYRKRVASKIVNKLHRSKS